MLRQRMPLGGGVAVDVVGRKNQTKSPTARRRSLTGPAPHPLSCTVRLPLRPSRAGELSRFLHAAVLNLGLRLVGIDRVEMRVAAQHAPHEFFADVVNACMRVDLHLV